MNTEETNSTFKIYESKPDGWKFLKVGEIADVNPTQIQKKYPYSEIQYIDISSVSPRKLKSFQLIDLNNAPSRAKRIVKDRDTIISTVRPNRKSYLYMKIPKPNTVVSTGFAVIRPRKIDSRFLHYAVTSDEFMSHLTMIAEGSTTAYPAVNPDIIFNTLIPVPPKGEDKKIGEILGSLDDKIELNTRMNKTLEEMAAAVFKSWFVDFEFPNKDDEPYKSSGGEMEYNKELEKEIPKGWRVVRLTDVIEINPRLSIKKGAETTYLEMKDLPTNSMSIFSDKKRPFTSGSKFQNCDTLLARITPCLENGKTGYVDFLEDGEIGFGSTEFLVFSAGEDLCSEFVYCLTRNEDFRNFSITNMTGTSGRQRVSKDCYEHYFIALPPNKEYINKFHKNTNQLFRRIRENETESRSLAAIRDALLPKLMNGEIRVKV